MSRLSAHSLSDIPEVRFGDDLAGLIVAAVARTPVDRSGEAGAERRSASKRERSLHEGQLLVIAHKVVSKAEGAVRALADVRAGSRARELAIAQAKDPRAVQVVLEQSAEIVRAERDVLICRTAHGFVCANAGVDASNASDRETLVTLPRDPDASARALRARLRELTGAKPAVLITDSFGRPWRHGQCDVAIGCAGLAPLDDWRGRTDASGMPLRASWAAIADAAAATADLARAKDSREPVIVIDGLERFVTAEDGPGAVALLRPMEEDLFR